MFTVQANHKELFSSIPWADFSLLFQDIEVDGGKKHVWTEHKKEEFFQLIFNYTLDFLALNEEINLTAIRDPNSFIWKQFFDSLLITKLNITGNILDIGTGGGFPGVPIIFWKFFTNQEGNTTLIDSVAKKIHAISGLFEKYSAKLDLDSDSFNFSVSRSESYLKVHRKPIDLGILRAVAPASKAVNFLDKKIPRWVIYCGPNNSNDWLKEEKKILKKGFQSINIQSFELPNDLGTRILLEINR